MSDESNGMFVLFDTPSNPAFNPGLDHPRTKGDFIRIMRECPNRCTLLNVPFDIWYHIGRALDLTRHVPGCVAECGCFIGNTSKGLMQYLIDHGDSRMLHMFDVFTGLPVQLAKEWEIKESARPEWFVPFLNIEDLDIIHSNLHEFPGRYVMHQGLFSETLPQFDEPASFIFSDGDLYESTLDTIRFADRNLSVGGVIMFHDYDSVVFVGVSRAITEALDPYRYWLIEPTKKPPEAEYGMALAIKLR